MIRYDKKLNAEIKRITSNYNAKIRRLSKKSDIPLPKSFDKEALKNLKSSVINRKELRRRLKELENFTKRGGEKLIKVDSTYIPKYKYQNIKMYQRLLKYQTTVKLKKYQTTHARTGIVEEPFTFSQLGSQDYLNLKAKREILLDRDLDSIRDYDEYIEKLRKNTKPVDVESWKKNYIDILQDTAISYLWDDEKLEDTVKKLNSLSAREFDDLFFRDRNLKGIIYYYKALLDIQTQRDIELVGADVRANLDEFYDNLNEIIALYEK